MLTKEKANYFQDKNSGDYQPEIKPFSPKGGLTAHASYRAIEASWNRVKGWRPEAASVEITVASDGAIWIVEDKNRAVIRIASYDGPVDPPLARRRRTETALKPG